MQNVKDQLGLHQREAAAISPLMQSVISAGVVFVPALVIGIAFRVREPVMPALVVASIVLALVWFGRLWQWLGLTAIIEQATGIDLPGGLDADELEQLRAEIDTLKSGKTLRVENRNYDSDGALTGGSDTIEDGELVVDIASALYNRGLPFSVGKLVEEFKIISRDQYDRLTADDDSGWIKRDGRGYLEWKNPTLRKLGCRPTPKGEAMLRAALEGSPPAIRQ
jgi:hypothetical protein